MAQATRKTDVAGRRIAKKGEPEFARYTEKEVTPVINSFGDWLEENTGLTLTKRDRQILFIGSALRGTFQKSDYNQERIAARKEEIAAEEEAREQRAAEREERRAAREAAAAERKSAPKTAPAKSAAKSTAPAKKGATAKSAPAKTGTTRRRPVASKNSNSDF